VSGFQVLQASLPLWVNMERHTGDAVVSQREVSGVRVTEVLGFPEAPADAEHGTFTETSPDRVRADVHFVEIAPSPDFPDREELIEAVKDALGEGEFGITMSADDLAGGPSYITLGGWLGSQDLALMLIGAVELAGIAKAITPKVLGMTWRDGRHDGREWLRHARSLALLGRDLMAATRFGIDDEEERSQS
jgi:hypothetical protein